MVLNGYRLKFQLFADKMLVTTGFRDNGVLNWGIFDRWSVGNCGDYLMDVAIIHSLSVISEKHSRQNIWILKKFSETIKNGCKTN